MVNHLQLALIILNSIGIFFMFCEFFYIVKQKPSRMQIFSTLFVVNCLINNIGYSFEMVASNYDMALTAVKFSYCGKVFILLCLMLVIFDYCRIKLSHIIPMILFILDVFILYAVLSCSHHKLFYTSISWLETGIFSHLEVTHGIVYYLFIVLEMIQAITIVTHLAIRGRKLKNKQERHGVEIVSLLAIVPILGFVGFLVFPTPGYDLTSLVYLFTNMLFMGFNYYLNFFDVDLLAKELIAEVTTEGVLVLNSQDEIEFKNRQIKQIFGNQSDKEILTELQTNTQDNEYVGNDGKIYSLQELPIKKRNRVVGNLIQLHDITPQKNQLNTLSATVDEKTRDLETIQTALLNSLASMIEARDDETGGHVQRTCAYVLFICQGLIKENQYVDELTESYIDDLVKAAPLHDIGKISIPDSILLKPGKLSEEEFEIIKTHPQKGAQMIQNVLRDVKENEYLEMAEVIAHYHHEKWNGKGYPCGLKELEIPLAARIMAVADVYDALTSERPYKKAFTTQEAIQILKDEKGKSFDPIIVDAFIHQMGHI